MARFCPDCGTKRVDDAPFCESCGYAFAAVPEAEPEVAPPAEALADSPAPEAPDIPAAETPAESEESESGEPIPRASRKKPLLVGLGAVSLVAVGVALWWTGSISLPGSQGGSAAPAAQLNIDLMPVAFGERCGYVNAEGQMVINPQFEGGLFFLAESGLAPVRMGGKWGLINREGQFVVNPQFDFLSPIAGARLFIAQMGDHAGIVDEQGTFVVNPQFDGIWGFDSDGRSVAITGGRAGIIDLRGNFIIPPQFDSIRWHSDWGEAAGFTHGLVAAQSGGQWGFIDPTGEWVINPQFADARSFGESGIAAVKVGANPPPSPTPGMMMDSTVGSGRWGYIDRAGRLVIAPQFEYAYDFAGNGLAPIQLGGQWGYIDRTGRFKINPQFGFAGQFERTPSGWTAAVGIHTPPNAQGIRSSRMGAIDENGAFRINPQFDDLGRFDHNGRAVVQVGNVAGLIDETGRFIVNPVYSELRLIPGSPHYFYVKPAGATANLGTSEIGWIDRTGRVLTVARGTMCYSGGD